MKKLQWNYMTMHLENVKPQLWFAEHKTKTQIYILWWLSLAYLIINIQNHINFNLQDLLYLYCNVQCKNLDLHPILSSWGNGTLYILRYLKHREFSAAVELGMFLTYLTLQFPWQGPVRKWQRQGRVSLFSHTKWTVLSLCLATVAFSKNVDRWYSSVQPNSCINFLIEWV